MTDSIIAKAASIGDLAAIATGLHVRQNWRMGSEHRAGFERISGTSGASQLVRQIRIL
jgi:hypothetical protein